VENLPAKSFDETDQSSLQQKDSGQFSMIVLKECKPATVKHKTAKKSKFSSVDTAREKRKSSSLRGSHEQKAFQSFSKGSNTGGESDEESSLSRISSEEQNR